MAAPQNRTPRASDDAATRYRHAAELAVEQLDWCISYLREIRKPAIARALQNTRERIVARYRD
jgi:hypothetical protein